jgi:thiamine monophosphate kinase
VEEWGDASDGLIDQVPDFIRGSMFRAQISKSKVPERELRKCEVAKIADACRSLECFETATNDYLPCVQMSKA